MADSAVGTRNWRMIWRCRRLAINVWLQHARRHDVLKGAVEAESWSSTNLTTRDVTARVMDLGKALATLPGHVRVCIVCSYQVGTSVERLFLRHQILGEASGGLPDL